MTGCSIDRDDLRALLDERFRNEHEADDDDVDAIIALVQPVAGGTFDRDQARDVLLDLLQSVTGNNYNSWPLWRELDRLAGCVRPATIDRDALAAILRSYGVDGDALDEALDRIEATR